MGFSATLLRRHEARPQVTTSLVDLHAAPATVSTTSPVAAHEMQEGNPNSVRAGPLAKNAKQFCHCLIDGAIDAKAFMEACRGFAQVVNLLPWPMAPRAAREMLQNLAKIDATHEQCAARSRSLAALLEWEKDQGWHKPGGRIADKSAAMGLLWARFGLQTWRNFFTAGLQMADATGMESKRQKDSVLLFRAACYTSHGECMGWLARKGLEAATRTSMPWGMVTITLGPTTEDEMALWCDAVTAVIDTLTKMQMQLDLEDTRKSL